MGFPHVLVGTESAPQGKRAGLDPWSGKIPWRGAGQPTPVFSPGESHGHRILAVYSLCGHKSQMRLSK